MDSAIAIVVLFCGTIAVCWSFIIKAAIEAMRENRSKRLKRRNAYRQGTLRR